ncbi:MAG: RnfABCDGE type electron transport complex subunit B [Bacteroidales bacterium]|jgi:RnfABCDGE-type electron transport complex B subunit|nr:RnfABCDGE type electron transport complex subunit B [Bacteroidales bacterium]
MTSVIFYSIAVLGITAAVLALILFLVTKKFYVYEDPRVAIVAEKLPGANCGGCGFAGCKALAEAIVKKESLEGLNCPVGGADVMNEVGEVLGIKAETSLPKIAVVRCNGSKANTTAKVNYEGAIDCLNASMVLSSEGGCPNGCLGLGSCVSVCRFDAIAINKESGLPEVDENKCVACEACAKTCPRKVIEMRNKGTKNRRIFVSCINNEKGAVAKKNCGVACIGCGKCAKVCAFEAISINDNLAYIDFNKCKLCRKCIEECPTGAIHCVNFPPKKESKNEVAAS